ncbi:hypothetical protein QYE76_056201 [Lolium multiflorum]|uniref:homocysteine S-methyltransferase n=1 Tax=Lolium multiflorum TaxID=4521 RepID=A0AAD8T1R3_LOLMU|nr:hypothetical protein QYE76_056201 [Lolium multiflorum]
MGRGDAFVHGAADTLRWWVREAGGCLVVDGAMGTELEAHGADLQDELWSARCLVSAPHLIRKVHLDYLEAGANIITTASYQATLQGFQSRGLSREQSEELLRRSVHIAQEACAIFLEGRSKGPYAARENNDGSTERRPVLVAASVGSYGAYLADGSEYTGDYGRSVTKESLKKFHRRRLQVLADAGPDLIAFETIPNKLEAQAYCELLEENDIRIPAWFSFTSKDGASAASGDPITDCAAVADSSRVAAVGINCTAPRLIHGLILAIKKVTSKPVVVYPNTGETYVAETKEWVDSAGGGGASATDFVSCVGKWRQAGASVVGGCCRTSPATVRAIARALREAGAAAADFDEYDDFPAVAVL